MQRIAYEGYFDNGRFYSSGKPLHIPEKRRVIITILDDEQVADSEEIRKREMLRSLRGSCKDHTMVQPSEISKEYDLPREYELI